MAVAMSRAIRNEGGLGSLEAASGIEPRAIGSRLREFRRQTGDERLAERGQPGRCVDSSLQSCRNKDAISRLSGTTSAIVPRATRSRRGGGRNRQPPEDWFAPRLNDGVSGLKARPTEQSSVKS